MAKKRDIFSKKNKITSPLNIPGQEQMIKQRISVANQDLGIKLPRFGTEKVEACWQRVNCLYLLEN